LISNERVLGTDMQDRAIGNGAIDNSILPGSTIIHKIKHFFIAIHAF